MGPERSTFRTHVDRYSVVGASGSLYVELVEVCIDDDARMVRGGEVIRVAIRAGMTVYMLVSVSELAPDRCALPVRIGVLDPALDSDLRTRALNLPVGLRTGQVGVERVSAASLDNDSSGIIRRCGCASDESTAEC